MRSAAAICSFLLLLLTWAPATAQTQAPAYTIELLRARAQKLSHEVVLAQIGKAHGDAQLLEARASTIYLGSARLQLAPTAMRRGDLGHNAQGDLSFSRNMGLWMYMRLYVAVPITSWWRIIHLWRAAQGAVTMAESQVLMAQREARMEVERTFRSAQVAVAQLRMNRQTRRRVAQLLAAVELRLDEDLPGVDETDRLRLSISITNLNAQAIGLTRSRRRAHAQLRATAQLPPRSRVTVPQLPLGFAQLAPLDWYLEAARHNRPEVAMSAAGVEAARAVMRLRLGELIPDVAAAVYYSQRTTPIVEDQRSAFSFDVWNSVALGYGLGYEYSLDFAGIAFRTRQARADHALAQAMRRFALGGVAFEVETAYVEVLEAMRNVEARARGLAAAERRVALAESSLARGQFSARDAAGAVQEWLGQWSAHIQAQRSYLLSLAQLEGAAALPPGSIVDLSRSP